MSACGKDARGSFDLSLIWPNSADRFPAPRRNHKRSPAVQGSCSSSGIIPNSPHPERVAPGSRTIEQIEFLDGQDLPVVAGGVSSGHSVHQSAEILVQQESDTHAGEWPYCLASFRD